MTEMFTEVPRYGVIMNSIGVLNFFFLCKNPVIIFNSHFSVTITLTLCYMTQWHHFLVYLTKN